MASRFLLLLALLGVSQLCRFTAAFVAPVPTARPRSTAGGLGRCSPRVALSVCMAAKGKKSSASFKGFGAKPAKLEDRTPESDEELCECKSGKSYGECCKPFHDGERWPETPLQLMRSRYTGYAYRLPDWIIDTTHKSNSDWKASRSKWFNELLGFCDGFNFEGLEIVEDKAGDEGEHYIEFVARMTAVETAPSDAPKGVKNTLRRVKYQAGTDKVGADFRERSKFVQEGGKWMYQGGDVDFDPKATLIMEDGTRVEAPEPKEGAAEEKVSEELQQKFRQVAQEVKKDARGDE